MQPQLHEAHVALEPFDLHATMAQQLLGHFDPTGRRRPDAFDKVQLDVDGRPLAWRFNRTAHGFRVRVRGDGAERALSAFLAQFPLADGCEDFTPRDEEMRQIVRSCGGLRLMRMPWAFDVAAGAVLQQRVRWQVAYNDFRRIALRWGTRTKLGTAFPTARQLAAVSPAALEAQGIDPKRARALHVVARLEATRCFLTRDTDPHRLRLRLLQLPGVGPWTANMIAGYAAGDPDAVPVGDLHIPSLVTWALAGEPEGTDERMLELLEPYRGQRFRVIRLLSWGWKRRRVSAAGAPPKRLEPAGVPSGPTT